MVLYQNIFLLLTSVHPQMIDFGSGQGLSDFETGGIACYFEDFKREKTPLTKRNKERRQPVWQSI